jgi:hypothetical protein
MISSHPQTIKPLYVVDTNTLIWYLTQDRKLGVQALSIFQAAKRGETRYLFLQSLLQRCFMLTENTISSKIFRRHTLI